MERKPLPLTTVDWRSRWLVTNEWDKLHRIAEIRWGWVSDENGKLFQDTCEDEKINGIGVTLCGIEGPVGMPGIFSRMGLERCPRCCELMGIPEGKGNPFNEGIREACDPKKE